MQFGKTLMRLLRHIHLASPRLGPVYISKIDIADGFYRINVCASDIPHLAVLFPSLPGERQLIAFPLTLPMGWKESPPIFCAATETVTDLANNHIHWDAPPHRLYTTSEVAPPPHNAPPLHPTLSGGCTAVPDGGLPHQPHFHKPLGYWDVYVDDFIGLVQGHPRRRKRIKSVLLHALDDVFRPLQDGDNPHRQEPASVKKMLKGDATWAMRKTILGWDVDTIVSTISLPPHRVQRLQQVLSSIAPRAASPSAPGTNSLANYGLWHWPFPEDEASSAHSRKLSADPTTPSIDSDSPQRFMSPSTTGGGLPPASWHDPLALPN